jgi:hypothetical protein
VKNQKDLPEDPRQRARAKQQRIIERRWIANPTKLHAGPMLVYINGPKGQQMVEQAGFEVKRTGFGDGTGISDHNWHNINANKPLITAHLWAEQTPGARIAAMQTAFDFDRNKKLREVTNRIWGINHGMRMDGLLAVAFEDEDIGDRQFLIEFETGSQEPAAIRRKVEGLVRFEQYFSEVFGSDLFSGYLFFATATHGVKYGDPRYKSPDDHRKVLLREIAKQLGEMDLREEFGPLFRVTSEPPHSLNLFDRPVWWLPDHYEGPYHLFSDVG